MATGSEDRSVTLFEAETGICITQIQNAHSDCIKSVAFKR